MTETDPRAGGPDGGPDGGPAGPAAGKGRPTPKRVTSRRSRGPVGPPPQTRREAAARQRAQQAEGRKALRAGVAANDERAMLKRDAGPVRSLLRDVIDARRNVGVLLLPLAVLLLVGQLAAIPRLTQIVFTVWIAGILALFVDIALIAWKVRKLLADRFPGEGGTFRHTAYALLRSTVFRRLRMPPPKVAVGQQV